MHRVDFDKYENSTLIVIKKNRESFEQQKKSSQRGVLRRELRQRIALRKAVGVKPAAILV